MLILLNFKTDTAKKINVHEKWLFHKGRNKIGFEFVLIDGGMHEI